MMIARNQVKTPRLHKIAKENASRAKHHYGNKAFIKKFREEAKLTYAQKNKGVDAKCKCKKGLVKRASNA
jgi:hypothetical protein